MVKTNQVTFSQSFHNSQHNFEKRRRKVRECWTENCLVSHVFKNRNFEVMYEEKKQKAKITSKF